MTGSVRVIVQGSDQDAAVCVGYLLAYALDLARVQVQMNAPAGVETLHFVGLVRALLEMPVKPLVHIEVSRG